MKYRIRRTSQFKKDVKRVCKRGKGIEELLRAIQKLAEGLPLSEQYDDHPLKRQYKGKRDCHLRPDWISIYAFENDQLVLYRTGAHADLFR
ncbi:type II toxin-antitoxin system YafQ family toxin [Desulfococcaceae bacterium HSG9]|nr:type II toxin-antitoxin system YafQ family toxin [Desulfococcaceae bacterium HSG9]